MQFFGQVVKHAITNDKKKYAVVEIENKINLNYRLFVPGTDLLIGQRIKVTLEVQK